MKYIYFEFQFSMAKTSLSIISVAHTGKENTMLRGSVRPEHMSFIPNAVDSVAYTSEQQRRVIIIRDVVKIVIDSIYKTLRTIHV